MADFNELISKDGVRKSISVSIIPNNSNEYINIPSEYILFESLKFTESICSQNEFKFGRVEQSIVEFSMANYRNITGEVIEIYFYVYDEDGSRYMDNLGRFKVTESKKSADNANIRKVIAMSDIDAPQGIINIFKQLQKGLEKNDGNYLISPELLIYGATKNPYSYAFKYCRFTRNRYMPAVYAPYDRADGARFDFYIEAREWDYPMDTTSNRSYGWNNSLFYLSDSDVFNFVTDEVFKRVDDAIDAIISESGLNPPASYNIKVKKRAHSYLTTIQSFWDGLNRHNKYMYFIPTKNTGGYNSPFVDAFKLEFNGKERIVYFLGDTLPFTSVEILDTKYDEIKDIRVYMNLNGLDMSNDEWMKKLRSDWFELTGRVSVDRESAMPYTAVPTELLIGNAIYPADNLYPSNSLYPNGAAHSFYAEDIKKFYADDEEDINRYTVLKLSFTDENKQEHIVTRPFNKINVEDVLIEHDFYSGDTSEIDIFLDGYTSKKWIMDSNVIKIYSDVSMYVSIEFLDRDDNVIATGLNNQTGTYYKHIYNNRIEYIDSYHRLNYGYTVFESDNFKDVFKIRIKNQGTSLSREYVQQHIKIYNEIFDELNVTGNTYVIDSNICLQRFNLDPGTVMYFTDNLESKLKELDYMDISLTMRGNPSVIAGNPIEIVTKDGAYDSYVFRRTINGIQSLTDVIEAR